jgi:hypothetical protein
LCWAKTIFLSWARTSISWIFFIQFYCAWSHTEHRWRLSNDEKICSQIICLSCCVLGGLWQCMEVSHIQFSSLLIILWQRNPLTLACSSRSEHDHRTQGPPPPPRIFKVLNPAKQKALGLLSLRF